MRRKNDRSTKRDDQFQRDLAEDSRVFGIAQRMKTRQLERHLHKAGFNQSDMHRMHIGMRAHIPCGGGQIRYKVYRQLVREVAKNLNVGGEHVDLLSDSALCAWVSWTIYIEHWRRQSPNLERLEPKEEALGEDVEEPYMRLVS